MKAPKQSHRTRSVSISCVAAVVFSLTNNPSTQCHAADFQTQREAGYLADSYVAKQEGLLHDEELTRRIDKIGQRMVKAAQQIYPEASEFRFTFRVINSPEINAASVAGGYVYIYSGLLDYLESEAEVAAVIGHEIGHIIKGHYTKRIESKDRTTKAINFFAFMGGVAAGVATSNMAGDNYSPQTRADMASIGAVGGALVVGFTGVALGSAMLEGYLQDQELDADSGSMKMLTGAGYDHRAMISLMKKFSYLEEKEEAFRQKEKAKKKKSTTSREPHRKTHFLNAKPGLKERAEKLELLEPK